MNTYTIRPEAMVCPCPPTTATTTGATCTLHGPAKMSPPETTCAAGHPTFVVFTVQSS